MSVVDDLKNTLRGSDSSSERSARNRSSSSRTNDGGPESGLGAGPETGSQNGSLRSGSRGQKQEGIQGSNLDRHGNSRETRNSGVKDGGPIDQVSSKGRSESKGRNQHPNAQAGRPQEGSSRPQVSSQTERKMENAGISGNASKERQSRQSGASLENDFEELKSQNRQIIDLLKRINRNLEQLGR